MNAKYNKQWYEKNAPGPGVIGKTYKLAENAINPMWHITDGLEKFVEKVGKNGLLPKPKGKKKTKMVSVDGAGKYLVKQQELDDELSTPSI